MSIKIGKPNNESKKSDAEESKVMNDQLSIELTEERIGANFEPLNEQMWKLTQWHDQLINNNSGKTAPTATSLAHRPRTRSSPDNTDTSNYNRNVGVMLFANETSLTHQLGLDDRLLFSLYSFDSCSQSIFLIEKFCYNRFKIDSNISVSGSFLKLILAPYSRGYFLKFNFCMD